MGRASCVLPDRRQRTSLVSDSRATATVPSPGKGSRSAIGRRSWLWWSGNRGPHHWAPPRRRPARAFG